MSRSGFASQTHATGEAVHAHYRRSPWVTSLVDGQSLRLRCARGRAYQSGLSLFRLANGFFAGLPDAENYLFICRPRKRSQNGYTIKGAIMREIALREFRTRGAKALEDVPGDETVLLAGQRGPAYFLVPVLGNITQQDRELRRAMAKASLLDNWRRAQETHSMTGEEIEREISAARERRRPRAR